MRKQWENNVAKMGSNKITIERQWDSNEITMRQQWDSNEITMVKQCDNNGKQ